MATTSFQELPEPSCKYALVGSPSVVLSTAALVSIPINQQLHEPSPKNSDTDTLSAGTPIATSVSLPMEIQKETSMTSHELYLKAIKEICPDVPIGQLSSNMAFHKDWATTRAFADLKAFTIVKSMISDKKLVYYDRTSIDDDDDSDESVASYMQKSPRK